MEHPPSSLSVAKIFSSISMGALVGGVLTMLDLLVMALAQEARFGVASTSGVAMGVIALPIAVLWAGLTWWMGMVIFGILPWLILDGLGFRSWRVAALFGLVVTFIGTFAIEVLPPMARGSWPLGDHNELLMTGGTLTHAGWIYYATYSAVNAAIGVVVALTVWWMAYSTRRLP
jgi:hypothetical protein